MQMLLRDIRRVGFFRPIINDESERKDHDIDLVLSQFYLGLQYHETYALTMRQAKELVNAGQHSLLIEKIINKYKELESKCDFVLLEGTDFEGTSPAFEFDINADIAANLGSPILVVSNACQKTNTRSSAPPSWPLNLSPTRPWTSSAWSSTARTCRTAKRCALRCASP